MNAKVEPNRRFTIAQFPVACSLADRRMLQKQEGYVSLFRCRELFRSVGLLTILVLSMSDCIPFTGKCWTRIKNPWRILWPTVLTQFLWAIIRTSLWTSLKLVLRWDKGMNFCGDSRKVIRQKFFYPQRVVTFWIFPCLAYLLIWLSHKFCRNSRF